MVSVCVRTCLSVSSVRIYYIYIRVPVCVHACVYVRATTGGDNDSDATMTELTVRDGRRTIGRARGGRRGPNSGRLGSVRFARAQWVTGPCPPTPAPRPPGYVSRWASRGVPEKKNPPRTPLFSRARDLELDADGCRGEDDNTLYACRSSCWRIIFL